MKNFLIRLYKDRIQEKLSLYKNPTQKLDRPTTDTIGVLCVNLGTPDGYDAGSLRRYLGEFLSDTRVVELPALFWQPFLRGIILPLRPRKISPAYKSIWNEELNESPLLTITRNQATEIGKKLTQNHGTKVHTDFAMRYGTPSIPKALQDFEDRGIDRVLIVPLYPHYSSPTTGTVLDACFKWWRKRRLVPAVRSLPAYYDNPAYIDALCKSIKTTLAQSDTPQPEVIVCSLHGMPADFVRRGDTYRQQCERTVELVRQKMKYTDDNFKLTFQSRFGPDEWLQPYTSDTVEQLAKSGVKSMAIMAPGFSADCLETIEELCEEVRDEFIHHGGEHFTYIPCLNDTPNSITMLTKLIETELQGWV